ncbi:MAG: PilN domain-containing protein [Syntrophomonadaceae bacterium]
MKTLVCIYCEGSDTKLAVVAKDKKQLKLLRAADFNHVSARQSSVEAFSAISLDGMQGDISLGDLGGESSGTPVTSGEGLLNSALSGMNLNNCEFVPAITEPAVHYHVFEGSKDLKDKNPSKLVQAMIEEIQKSKNITVAKNNLGYEELAGGQYLSVFADGEIHCLANINALARVHGRKFYRIPSVKCADLSLAYYAAQKKKFFPDDYSLVVYIGKEYSKLIFLQGKELKHIGATLDIGTANLHTYDVYFSKILLEMENGGIPRIDNVVICGEDESENLVLSFYGTFPEANVSKLDFADLDTSLISEDLRENVSSFSVPIAVAFEYFAELDKKHKGINLLPRYIREDQKTFQFAWYSLFILPLIFLVTFFFTKTALVNNKEINRLDKSINELTLVQQRNQKILDEINHQQGRITNFGATQAILDSASKGAEVWGTTSKKMADFIMARKGMWVTEIKSDAGNQVSVNGYSLTRGVVTAFSDYNEALLKSMVYEPLREKTAYKFIMNFNMLKNTGKTK